MMPDAGDPRARAGAKLDWEHAWQRGSGALCGGSDLVASTVP